MQKYIVTFQYSRDNKTWYASSRFVSAETQRDAISIIKSQYTYVKIKSAVPANR